MSYQDNINQIYPMEQFITIDINNIFSNLLSFEFFKQQCEKIKNIPIANNIIDFRQDLIDYLNKYIDYLFNYGQFIKLPSIIICILNSIKCDLNKCMYPPEFLYEFEELNIIHHNINKYYYDNNVSILKNSNTELLNNFNILHNNNRLIVKEVNKSKEINIQLKTLNEQLKNKCVSLMEKNNELKTLNEQFKNKINSLTIMNDKLKFKNGVLKTSKTKKNIVKLNSKLFKNNIIPKLLDKNYKTIDLNNFGDLSNDLTNPKSEYTLRKTTSVNYCDSDSDTISDTDTDSFCTDSDETDDELINEELTKEELEEENKLLSHLDKVYEIITNIINKQKELNNLTKIFINPSYEINKLMYNVCIYVLEHNIKFSRMHIFNKIIEILNGYIKNIQYKNTQKIHNIINVIKNPIKKDIVDNIFEEIIINCYYDENEFFASLKNNNSNMNTLLFYNTNTTFKITDNTKINNINIKFNNYDKNKIIKYCFIDLIMKKNKKFSLNRLIIILDFINNNICSTKNILYFFQEKLMNASKSFNRQ